MNLSALIISQAPDGILFISDSGAIMLANDALCNLAGYKSHELVGQSVEIFLPADLRRLHAQSRWAYVENPKHRPMATLGELTLLRKDGTTLPVEIALSRVADAFESGTIAFVRDASEAKKSQRQLQLQATHDELTGLGNRRSFTQQLNQALLQADRTGHQLALLLLYLDGFKSVNDSFGHLVGDKLLVTIAKTLKTHVRASDVVARVGGDEFVVLLRDIEKLPDAVVAANKLVAALSLDRMIDNVSIKTGCSLGIAMYPKDARDAEALIRCADLAMYQAKSQGRGRSIPFSSEMQDMIQTVRLV